MDNKNRQKLLLILAATALVLLLGDWFVFSPLLESWKSRSQRILDLRQKVAQGEYKVKREASIRSQWDRMRTNALPSNASLAESQMLKSFDRWERSSGLARLSIKPQWKQAEDAFMTLECRVDYAGDVDRLTRFLYEVEKDPLGLKIDNVEISSRDDNGRQLTLGLQVSGLLLSVTNAPSQP